jgi:erythromycin esterase-like protein
VGAEAVIRDDAIDAVLRRAEGKRFVLLGEASHGTHEFYDLRAEITKRLIEEQGLDAVAVEADWPDAYRVNRYVRGGEDDDPLGGFTRFPAWMWRNTVVRDFVEWLRGSGVGFYGLDLYSLHSSIEAVLQYLDDVDPDAAARARERYACFDHVGGDPQDYGYAAITGVIEACEPAVVQQLSELRRLAEQDGHLDEDERFFAEQNARVVLRAEQYYRAMFRGRAESWNLRDRHMFETLEALSDHLGSHSRIAVWAHNSHLGDARATELSANGELNLGQLVRDAWADDSLLVGFTTYTGSVTAAHDWGDEPRRMSVRRALDQSVEAAFHEEGGDAVVEPRDSDGLLERAIGVIYRPRTERQSHYFRVDLREQFDLVVHLDVTRALEPLDRTSRWDAGEPPETYPSGI